MAYHHPSKSYLNGQTHSHSATAAFSIAAFHSAPPCWALATTEATLLQGAPAISNSAFIPAWCFVPRFRNRLERLYLVGLCKVFKKTSFYI